MSAIPFRTLLVQSEAAVTTIALNRPERRNAIGLQMVTELEYALDDAFEDPSVRCIVLTGSGSSFCAGGDFTNLAGPTEADFSPRGDYADLLLHLVRAPKPVVAKVNGHALGGGLGLVVASTFAVVSSEAKLGTPEINVGLFPMMIMAVLTRLIPRKKLLEMMLFGEKLSAEEALGLGLVNRVAPPNELDETVARFCELLLSKSPTAVRLGLKAFADQDDLPLDQALPLLRERLAECAATEDALEGLAAFLEKRPPRWSGR